MTAVPRPIWPVSVALIQRWARPQSATINAMRSPARDELVLLPGSRLVLFVVRVDRRPAVIAVPVAEFLDGLRAAKALLGFGNDLQRDDLTLDELLPWAGSV